MLCTLHWTKSTQHPTTTAWNTNGRGNFGCSSPGCCPTAHAMQTESQNHSCSNGSVLSLKAIGNSSSQPVRRQANARTPHSQQPIIQQPTAPPRTKEPTVPPSSLAWENYLAPGKRSWPLPLHQATARPFGHSPAQPPDHSSHTSHWIQQSCSFRLAHQCNSHPSSSGTTLPKPGRAQHPAPVVSQPRSPKSSLTIPLPQKLSSVSASDWPMPPYPAPLLRPSALDG